MTNLIQKAKKVSIITLYHKELRQSGKAYVGICPLHDDKNASFAIYPETNSFYCFTEGIGGSVIDLYMKLHKVDFKEAVKELTQ